MSVIIFFVVVAVSLVVGSFLTVVTEDPDGYNWIKRKRSECPKCKHVLGVIDLVPVFSFVFQKGKCRYCKEKIPAHHVFTELASLVVFILAYIVSQPQLEWNFVFLLLILTILLALSITDIKFFTLPDPLVIFLGLVGLLREILLEKNFVISVLIGGVLGIIILGSIALFSRGKAMGMGDVKLAGAMGLVLGWQQLLLALMVAFLMGGLVGFIMIVRKKASLKSAIPFGPFLTLSTALLLLFPEIYSNVLLFYGLM